jgi:hypothetical protein
MNAILRDGKRGGIDFLRLRLFSNVPRFLFPRPGGDDFDFVFQRVLEALSYSPLILGLFFTPFDSRTSFQIN